MKLSEYFRKPGRGAFATAGADGRTNIALYAEPHFIDEDTVVWGIIDGRTYTNLKENPNASYLYVTSSDGLSGIRLNLILTRLEDSGEMLDRIKDDTAKRVSQEAASLVKHVGYFKVAELRPLT